MAVKQTEEAQKTYSRSELVKLLRHDIDAIAVSLNIVAKRFSNKYQLVDAIMLTQSGDVEVKERKLTDKQELFCQFFASDREFFGNGVQSYIEAYNVDLTVKGAYDSARVNASKLLTNANILKRVDEIMEVVSLNDTAVDKQMAFWITQKANPMASIAAINQYNKLRKRIDDKTPPVAPTMQQNNYTVNITSDEGRTLSDRITEMVLDATKAPIKTVENES